MSYESRLITVVLATAASLMVGIGLLASTAPATIADLPRSEQDAISTLRSLDIRVRADGKFTCSFGHRSRVSVDYDRVDHMYHLTAFELHCSVEMLKTDDVMRDLLIPLQTFQHLETLTLPGLDSKDAAFLIHRLPKCHVVSISAAY